MKIVRGASLSDLFSPFSWIPLVRRTIGLRGLNPCANKAALALLTHLVPIAIHLGGYDGFCECIETGREFRECVATNRESTMGLEGSRRGGGGGVVGWTKAL